MIRTYSSTSFEKDRASQWLELLRTSLQWPVTFEWVDEAGFEAEIDCLALGDIHVLSHRISPLALQRSAGPDADAPQHFSLNYVVHGRMVLSHHERQNVLGGGDIVLADSRRPSRLTFEAPTRIITMRVPRSLLIPHMPEPERLCNVVLTQRHDFTGTIRAALLSLLQMGRKGASLQVYERSVEPLLGMLSFTYLANFGAYLERSRPRAGTWMRRIRQHIDDNIMETSLTPESIAAEFGLSARYLRKLFAAEGDSITRYILRRRLEKIAEKMSNLLWKERSITDICYDYGFNSAPHFTRAFKRQFGVTPREYRRRARISASVRMQSKRKRGAVAKS